jgi:type II secretory pathway pseudopilin PulG
MNRLSSVRRIKPEGQPAEQTPMLSRLRRRLLLRGDDGFTLVEAVVALAIAVIVFMALSFALIGGAHEVLLAQQNQQAGDVLNQVVEQARGLTYDQLVMQDADLPSALDPIGSSVNGCKCYNPTADTAAGATEPLAHAVTGGVNPHAYTKTLNGLDYTIREYVTAPTDTSGATYKRFTAVVRWTSLGRTHNRTYSTFVAATKRGLPLPNFKFSTAQGSGPTACAAPGSSVSFSFNVKNNGARDQWLISSTQSSPAAPVTWAYYIDANNNGVFDSASDAPVSTDPASGLPTTGLLDPNGTLTFFAIATAPSTVGTLAVNFTATSEAIQTYMQTVATATSVQTVACVGGTATPTPTATATATATPTPTPTSTAIVPSQPSNTCPPVGSALTANSKNGTAVSYSLYNPSTPSPNTVASQAMPVSKTAPATSTLYDYSTDLDATSAGRKLLGGTGDGSAPYVASWSYGMPASSTIPANGNGANDSNGEVSVYAGTNGVATATPTFTATLKLVNGNTTTTLASGTYTTPAAGWGCSGGYHRVWIDLPLPSSATTVPANANLVLSLSSSVAVYLAYGTTTFPMEFSVPYTAGVG